jgi:hypothetical protein
MQILCHDIGHEEGGEEELRIYNRRETRRK